MNAVVWVTAEAASLISIAEPSPNSLGTKAEGLRSLPSPWVPPYFVIDPTFQSEFFSALRRNGRKRLLALLATLEQACSLAGIGTQEELLLRSNAAHETLAERGRYQSFPLQDRNWSEGLKRLYEAAVEVGARDGIGVIVQRKVRALALGHLSNERRVAEEYRDAVVEIIDAASGKMTESHLSFRRWRNQNPPTHDALICRRGEDVLPTLREVLAFAAVNQRRVNFEWVWDGAFIHVVQADVETDSGRGFSPPSFVAAATSHARIGRLKHFRAPSQRDKTHFNKLRNHLLYEQLGIAQPPFYLLEDPKVIRAAVNGVAPDSLYDDIAKLTKHPLMLRTCSREQLTMLPRSDQLHSVKDVLKWISGKFKRDIESRKLDFTQIALLAHHYIPALASAFSTASANERQVYVEALWGIPEGIYYYPCDAYQVDTLAPNANKLDELATSRFTIARDKRYKGNFVAPDAKGRFSVHATEPPWDWKSVVADEDLRAIALLTRKLAAIEARDVKLMWFIGCPPSTNLQHLLPWYHDNETPSADETNRAPYSRNQRDEVFCLKTAADLRTLQQQSRRKSADAPSPKSQGRLVVVLDPREDAVIRQEDFAERAGAAAKKLGAVIELHGGVLSHVYYALRRTGAELSVRNVPRFRIASSPPPKLVRDKIPEVVAASGELAFVAHLAPSQRTAALKLKLLEEAFEARDATAADLAGELADVLEVVEALAASAQISLDHIDTVRNEKRTKRGGFESGVVLVDTSLKDNHNQGRLLQSSILETKTPQLEEIGDGTLDVRQQTGATEFVQTAVISLSHREWLISSPRRQLKAGSASDKLSWTIEGLRQGSRLRLRLRLMVGEDQAVLDFESLPQEPLK